MTKIILFTSLKGGVGVTTVCLGVGVALAKKGARTLIVDGEKNYCAALLDLGIACPPVYTLADYARGACRAKQTMATHPEISNLAIVSAAGVCSTDAAARAVDDLGGLFDYILLDDAPNVRCDEAIIVTEPYLASIKAADVRRAQITDTGVEKISLIINKFSAAQFAANEIAGSKRIAAALRLNLRGVVSEDLTLTSGKCKPSTKKEFSAIADAITSGNDFEVKTAVSTIRGFILQKMRNCL